MSKSPDAFRTISEVADWLGIQAHVLRFWESKFTQVKPIKRAGGRRYYRPNDMLLLGGIKKLLHDDGLTIKGVQKILREEGMNHVASLSMPLDDLTDLPVEAPPAPAAPMLEDAEPETGVVLPFDGTEEPEDDVKSGSEPTEIEQEDARAREEETTAVEASSEPDLPEVEKVAAEPEEPADTPATAEDELPLFEETPARPTEIAADPAADAPNIDPAPEADPDPIPDAAENAPVERDPEPLRSAEAEAETETQAEVPSAPASEDMEPLPAFLRHPVVENPETDDTAETEPTDNLPPEPETSEPETVAADPEPPKARDIGMPDITPEQEIHAEPGALARSLMAARPSADRAAAMRPLLAQLSALSDSMQAQRNRAGGKD